MFLLVSGRHVGPHTDGHQHGVSMQSSINLGKKFLRISRIRKIAVTRILARVFAYLPSFISQIVDFIYWQVLIFILIYFELRDTENQQYVSLSFKSRNQRLWNLCWPQNPLCLSADFDDRLVSCLSQKLLSDYFMQSRSSHTRILLV